MPCDVSRLLLLLLPLQASVWYVRLQTRADGETNHLMILDGGLIGSGCRAPAAAFLRSEGRRGR